MDNTSRLIPYTTFMVRCVSVPYGTIYGIQHGTVRISVIQFSVAPTPCSVIITFSILISINIFLVNEQFGMLESVASTQTVSGYA